MIIKPGQFLFKATFSKVFKSIEKKNGLPYTRIHSCLNKAFHIDKFNYCTKQSYQ